MFWEVIAVSAVAAVATQVIAVNLKQSSVRASAIIALVFGLPAYLSSAPAAYTLATAAIGASFAGMSSVQVVPNKSWMALIGALFALIFLSSSPLFAGNGGGLGVAACIATVITLGLMRLTRRLQKV